LRSESKEKCPKIVGNVTASSIIGFYTRFLIKDTRNNSQPDVFVLCCDDMEMLRLEAGVNDDGRRIDRILRKACADIPVSAIYRLLRMGLVLIDGKRAGLSTRVSSGQIIEVRATFARKAPAAVCEAGGDRLAVLYEGQGILAVNKPGGITSQEVLGARVRAYLAGKVEPSLSFMPGPLHRLDNGTSGVMVFGSSLAGARLFSALMRGGLLRKTYIALLEGVLREENVWDDRLLYDSRTRKTAVMNMTSFAAGEASIKSARTRVFPIKVYDGLTLVRAEIETGRTHQIRAQAAARGFPLYGDRKYGGKKPPPFFLHALRLTFPKDCPLPASITAPVPSAFLQKLAGLGFDVRTILEFR
jgi:23S rRNA pseudouridine955/2504/2580 synthase